jgi:hypothetical protein
MNKLDTPSNRLREAIALSLEAGAPTFADGTAMNDFTLLFGSGSGLPPMGLRFDEPSMSMVAEPFERAFGGPFFIPFDFDRDWAAHRSESAAACAREQLLIMAALLRVGQLPTICEALVKRFSA